MSKIKVKKFPRGIDKCLKNAEIKVTCELTFTASLVTKATTEKEAKEEAIKALAEAYKARGIDGIISVVPTKVELTKNL